MIFDWIFFLLPFALCFRVSFIVLFRAAVLLLLANDLNKEIHHFTITLHTQHAAWAIVDGMRDRERAQKVSRGHFFAMQ